jgi:hypothetical protein
MTCSFELVTNSKDNKVSWSVRRMRLAGDLAIAGPLVDGVTIDAGFSGGPVAVVSVEPVQISFPAQQQAVSVQVRGIAPGSAVIRLTAEDNFAVSGVPIAATVNP